MRGRETWGLWADAGRRRRSDDGRDDGQAEGGEANEGAPERARSDPPTGGLDAIDELSSALAALGEDV